MNSPGHLAVAAAAWTTVGPLLHLPGWQRGAGVVFALATSMVPDIDNSSGWKAMVPNGTFVGQVLGHRHLMHSWMIPALLLYVAWRASDPHRVDWTVLALATGWGSHIVADLVFGRGGVPLVGWGLRWGLELPMSGVVEWAATVACAAYAAVTVWVGPSVWVGLYRALSGRHGGA